MMEVGAVINLRGRVLHWHLPPGRTGGSLPDSRDLWDVLWDNRKGILGFAHSHPGGGGIPSPSYTDVTSFAAIEAGLGVRLFWWITSDTHLIVARWAGPERLDYKCRVVTPEYSWASELRNKSNQMKDEVLYGSP